MKEQLAQVTGALVDAAAPRLGMLVLDLASGTGEPALSLARRIAPTGKVTATDFSTGMLDALRANRDAEGVTNIEVKVCDAHELPFPDASFDLVTSRFGVMFFANIGRALAEIRRVVKPGGSIAFLVWGAPGLGTYFGAAAMPYMRRLAVKPDPDGPGPMRFAEPGKLARLVEAAGLSGLAARPSGFDDGDRRAVPECGGDPFRGRPARGAARGVRKPPPALRRYIHEGHGSDSHRNGRFKLANLRRLPAPVGRRPGAVRGGYLTIAVGRLFW